MKKVTLKYGLIFFMLLIASCNNETMIFEVSNYSEEKIDSLIISNGYDIVKIENFKNKQTENIHLEFIEKKPKSDGAFYIIIYPKNLRKDFGYYSNGAIPSYHYNILIKEKKIIVKEYSN